MIVGIDADYHRIAYAAVNRGRVTAIGTIARANQRGRLAEDYDQRVTALMRRCSEQGARVLLEGIFLSSRTDPGSKRNVDAFRRLAEVQGELKAAARRFGVLIETVSPSTWQAAMLPGVRGREAIKTASLALARERWGRPVTSHEADAVCLAMSHSRIKRTRLTN